MLRFLVIATVLGLLIMVHVLRILVLPLSRALFLPLGGRPLPAGAPACATCFLILHLPLSCALLH